MKQTKAQVLEAFQAEANTNKNLRLALRWWAAQEAAQGRGGLLPPANSFVGVVSPKGLSAWVVVTDDLGCPIAVIDCLSSEADDFARDLSRACYFEYEDKALRQEAWRKREQFTAARWDALSRQKKSA